MKSERRIHRKHSIHEFPSILKFYAEKPLKISSSPTCVANSQANLWSKTIDESALYCSLEYTIVPVIITFLRLQSPKSTKLTFEAIYTKPRKQWLKDCWT